MSWYDEFAVKIQQFSDKVPKDINDAIKQNVADQFVKIANNALGGNLTAAQIAQGQKGENPNASITPDVSTDVAALNANQASQINQMGSMLMGYLPIILLGGVGIYFLTKKSRG